MRGRIGRKRLASIAHATGNEGPEGPPSVWCELVDVYMN